jgi:hypothetical protein
MARAWSGTGLLITGAMLFQSDKAYQWEEYPVMGLAFLATGLFFIFRSTSGKP